MGEFGVIVHYDSPKNGVVTSFNIVFILVCCPRDAAKGRKKKTPKSDFPSSAQRKQSDFPCFTATAQRICHVRSLRRGGK